MLVKNGRLELTIGPETLLRRAERLSYLQFVGVDPHVAGRSVALPDIHGDPVDRLIVATAQELGCPLVSNDRRLRSYPDVEVIWQLPTSPGSKTLPSTNPSASAQPRAAKRQPNGGSFRWMGVRACSPRSGSTR